jgi:hypothetical protein
MKQVNPEQMKVGDIYIAMDLDLTPSKKKYKQTEYFIFLGHSTTNVLYEGRPMLRIKTEKGHMDYSSLRTDLFEVA